MFYLKTPEMKPGRIFVLLFAFLTSLYGISQDYRGLFVHAEYQALKYNYYQVGIGFHPKKHLVSVSRKHKKYSFIGYTLSYNNHFNNSDWGLAFQTVAYSGNYDGPIGIGLEWNLKKISGANHFGLKPMLGLSFPIWSVMYSYNFDLYQNKVERISQHELTLGLRIRVLKWR